MFLIESVNTNISLNKCENFNILEKEMNKYLNKLDEKMKNSGYGIVKDKNELKDTKNFFLKVDRLEHYNKKHNNKTPDQENIIYIRGFDTYRNRLVSKKIYNYKNPYVNEYYIIKITAFYINNNKNLKEEVLFSYHPGKKYENKSDIALYGI